MHRGLPHRFSSESCHSRIQAVAIPRTEGLGPGVSWPWTAVWNGVAEMVVAFVVVAYRTYREILGKSGALESTADNKVRYNSRFQTLQGDRNVIRPEHWRIIVFSQAIHVLQTDGSISFESR